ncbi:MAG: peptide/nickel transport system substrate-binding protein [Clostridia bacterium]|jgi:peptide/nickel transport system substrate-binding protein|nr:peptide/nickel transport system substrate-binding protein [Clostridia bacterium]
MKNKKVISLLVVLMILLMVITACGGQTKKDEPQKEGDAKKEEVKVSGPKMGGVLQVVIDADPPTIDPHASSTTLTFVVGYHIFEGLYTLDEQLKPIPMLAEDFPKISNDALTYTFKLRTGLKFHNGNSVTAEDVVASLKRWGNMSKYGKSLFKNVEAVEAKDEQTVELKLTKPTGTTLVSLAMPNGGAFIYPKELCEKYPDKPMEEFIGTGPFKFVEWLPNQYIKLIRYEEYQPVEAATNGYGGKKVAYLDELKFIPISDETVRITSVEGGEYDFADFVPVDEYTRLKDDPNIQAIPSAPRAWFAFNFNKRAGIMSNVKIREAFLTALDMEPILAAGYGDEAFWRVDPSIMLKEQAWWSDIGKEKYDQGDIEKAKKLLAEAGYKGEKIVWMSGPLEYNLSLAAKNQLEKAGFNIDLQSMEWATLADRRKNPELWDIFSTGMTLKPDPTMFTALNPNYAGWWESPRLIKLLDNLAQETEFNKRYAIMEEIQELFYTEIPTVKVGDYANLRILAKNVKGFTSMNEIFFWNVWKE